MSEERGEVLLEVRRLRPSRSQIIFGALFVILLLTPLVTNLLSVSFLESLLLFFCAIALLFHLLTWFFMNHDKPDVIIYSNGVKAKKLNWLDDSFISWSEISSIHLRHYARGGNFVVLMPFKLKHYWQQVRYRDVDIRDRIYHKTPLSISIPPKYFRCYDANVKMAYDVRHNALSAYHEKHGIKD